MLKAIPLYHNIVDYEIDCMDFLCFDMPGMKPMKNVENRLEYGYLARLYHHTGPNILNAFMHDDLIIALDNAKSWLAEELYKLWQLKQD